MGGTRARHRVRHLLLPALHGVQDAIGWISPAALNYVSERLARAAGRGVRGGHLLLPAVHYRATAAHRPRVRRHRVPRRRRAGTVRPARAAARPRAPCRRPGEGRAPYDRGDGRHRGTTRHPARHARRTAHPAAMRGAGAGTRATARAVTQPGSPAPAWGCARRPPRCCCNWPANPATRSPRPPADAVCTAFAGAAGADAAASDAVQAASAAEAPEGGPAGTTRPRASASPAARGRDTAAGPSAAAGAPAAPAGNAAVSARRGWRVRPCGPARRRCFARSPLRAASRRPRRPPRS